MEAFWKKSQKKEEERSWRCQDDQSEIALGYLLEDSSQVMEVAANSSAKEVTLNSVEDAVL